MAGLFEVRNLEARKRALVAESELYREILKLETQNLQLYGIRMRRRFSYVTKATPLILLAAPLAGLFLGRSKSPKRGWLATALMGWRLYRQLAPVLGVFFERLSGGNGRHPARAESGQPKA